MEKAEGEEELPVERGFIAAVELSFCHQLVKTLHVGFNTLRMRTGSVKSVKSLELIVSVTCSVYVVTSKTHTYKNVYIV